MHRPTLTAMLLSSSLLAGGAALAQAADQAPSTNAAAPAVSGEKFVTMQGNSEFRASKFVGIDVYGSENEKIGDISEILLDAQGNAKAIVIGVGGFLGIGQKNVAVPWSSVTWSNDPAPTKTAGTERPPSTGTTGAAGGGMTSGGGTTGGGASRPPASTPARSPAEQAAYNGYPDHAMVKLSKADLNAAPAFKYVSDNASATTAK